MKTIVVALAVALVTAGTTSAAFVITSKDIKNGTIQPIDLSAKTKRAMRGPVGPPGERGLVGTSLASGNSVTLGPYEQGQSIAICSQGKVTGGGWAGYSGPSLVVLRSFPLTGPFAQGRETWNVVAVNVSSTSSVSFGATAVCAY